jgi:Uma2 family endonuclease
MVTIETRRMSVEGFDEFVMLPENRDRLFEYIGGAIIEVVSNPESSKLAARLLMLMGRYFLQNDIGHVTAPDGGYTVGKDRYIPDIGFISYKKQPKLVWKDGYITDAPDLAVEILSPSNRPEEIRVKVANYLAAGCNVWVFDGEKKRIEVYVPGQPVRILGADDTLDGGAVLPGFTLAVREIFPAAADTDVPTDTPA